MTVLTSNLKVWYGNDGEVLSEGFIYVGQPNQDPTNPAQQKTVTFQDSQGNQTTATQPLRTNADGRIQFNGVAILAIVTGDYSLYITDSEGVQINDGYIPFVEDEQGGSAINLDEYRRYALTLADLKTLDVAPGDTVASIGRITAEDQLGANWLVSAATGSPGDDVDLIDFNNGLQGKRLRNMLQPYDNLDTLTDYAAARTNLNVYSTAQAIEDAAGTVSNTNLASNSVTNPKVAASQLTLNKMNTTTATSTVTGAGVFNTGVASADFIPLSTYFDNAFGDDIPAIYISSGTYRVRYSVSGSTTITFIGLRRS